MKRRLLLWMVTAIMTIVGVQNASAQASPQASYNHTYTKGVEVAAGDDYFLYNIGAKQFLTSGLTYGTRATVDNSGRVLQLTANGSGYSIYTNYVSLNNRTDAKAGYLTTNGYVDTPNNDAAWVFTPVDVDGYTNAYTISNSSTQYLYFDAGNTDPGCPVNVGNNTVNNFSYWLLIPKATREAAGDYSHYLINTQMNAAWEFKTWGGSTVWNDNSIVKPGGNPQNRCGEKWHAIVDIYQDVKESLPNGTYKLHVQGFYRQDGEAQGAPVLYANSDTQALLPLTGTENDMNQASASFSAGLYDGNNVQTTITNGSLRVGINITQDRQWVIFDNFVLYRVGDKLSEIAGVLPTNGNMAADTWYSYDVATTDLYEFVNATTFSDIVYVTDGNLDVYAANRQAGNFADEAGTHLTAGTYYIKSSSANHFEINNISPSTAAQMADLATAITTAKAHTLGFDNGEYAPYNNVANLQAIAEAEAIDQTTPGNYTATAIAAVISGLQNATWTANNGEVNGIAYGDLSQYETRDGRDFPWGWTGMDANSRIMGGSEGTNNAGLSATSTGKAMLLKYNAKYGEVAGYTMPLKANTYYKISFKYCGWGNTPTTNVVLTGPNGTVQVVPGSFHPDTNDGNSNATNWYEYTGVFKTGADAGNYVLALNKVETGQQQIAWGDMVLVRATAADLTYTPATGKMNAGVAAAQQAAAETFEANPTFENFEALIPAIDAANASVAIYQQIAARLALLAAQTGDIPQAAFEGSTTYTNYDNGVYSSLDQVIPQYKADVAAYWTTNTPNANADLTAFIVNNSFEFGNTDGWGHSTNGDTGVKEASNGTYRFTNSDGNYIFNTWTGNQELHYIFQEIDNLPNGTYEVTAVWAGWGDRELTFTANQFTTSETWDEVTDTFKPGDVQDGANETVGIERTIQAVVVNHKLRVGGRSDQFFKCDNFRLKYLTADILAPELATGQMNADVKAALLAAKATFDDDPSVDNYNALTEANNTAKASVQLYEQINARLALLTAADQRGGLTEAQMQAMSFYTKYSDGEVNGTADATTGTYTSLDEVIGEYKSSIADYYANNAPAANEDVTAFIINQGFDFGDNTAWEGGGGIEAGVNEWYNATFNQRQILANLPTGTYKLTAKAFYRPGGNGNASTTQNAQLYGGTTTSPVMLIATDGKGAQDSDHGFTTSNTNSGSEVFVPNSRGDAAKAFASDAYNNEVTFVVNGENVTIGIKSDTKIDYDWTCYDDFRLTYVSSEALVVPTLVNAPMNAAISTAQTEAYNTWDANKSVANYTALVEAIAAAQASADKYVIINARIPKLDAQTDIDVSALTTKYTNGEYVEADDVFDAYQEILATAFGTPAADTDMTAFIINPSFEFGDTDGWNVAEGVDTGAKDAHNGTYAFSNSDGDYVFNTWSNWNPEQFLWVFQDVKNLPNGTYELSAVWATEDGYRTVEFTAENVLPGNVVDGQGVTDSFRPVDIDTRATKADGFERSVTITVTDGTLRIGGHGYQFFKCDNFRLKFLGAGLVDPDPNIDDPNLCLPMNKYEREYYITARDAYNANQTPENLRKANEYRIMVENSIKAYAAAKVTLDHVQEMMNKTNVYTYDAFFTIDDMFRKYGFDGYYGFRTLEDDQAYELERMFFGTGNYRDHSNFGIPAVPFIASAWDCGYQDDKHKGYAYAQDGWVEGSDYYANTWSREGNDDGTLMLTPYLEYWKYGDDRLSPRTMTATVEGTPNATYTVKMFVRVRIDEEYTVDGNNEVNLNDVYPEGMTIQIGDGAEFTPTWTPVRNEGSIYILNNYRKLWVCNLWDENDPTNLPTGNVGADGTLQIKFNIKEGSNVTWLSMKDVYVNYETEVPAVEIAKLKQQIDYAKLHALGFDPDYYAPYTNVPQLIALHRAEQVKDAPENVFLVRAMTKALKALNYSGDKAGDDDGSTVLAYDASTDLWTKNTEEMNAFYWKNDYTSADVEHIEWYDYEDDCITPTGWNLIGRDDGFNNGIKKLGVNTGNSANGLKAVEDETVLYAKYETDYGNEPGYTVPLQKGVKYIMTFTYTYAGEGTCPETRVTLTVPKAGVDDTAASGLEVTEFTPIENGMDDMSKWYMYRATFTPTQENVETGELANYVITFDKDNYDPEPVMFGELTLVRYKEADDVINGDSKDFTYEYEPEFIGTDVQVTRSFNAGAYNTLVLPFKLSGGELKEALGENFDGKVYYYTGVGTTSGENRDYYQLKFEERTGGIFANVPVLIYSDASNPVNNWTNKTFTNMVTKYVKNDLTVDTDVFDFVGTYKTQKIPEGAWYIKADNNFYKSTGSANLQPTRGYFIPYNADGDVILHAKIMGFDIDDEPTGIMAIEEDGTMHVTSGNIYTLDGRLVRQNAKTLEGLPRGTYIVDGKKYMIK